MNKDKVQNQNILGTLVNKDESGIIAYSDQIYDKKVNKSLEEENIKQDKRLDNTEAKDRELQSTLENISKTGEASAASNVTYNHNDSQLDATNVQQAIDEVRKKSNYNDGENIIDFNTIHLITDNLEYICALIDANEKLLVGYKKDTGTPIWGYGVPEQIKDYIDKQVNTILGTNDLTTTIDSLKEVEKFLHDFSNSDNLKTLLDKKADKTSVDSKADLSKVEEYYKNSNPNDDEGNVVPTKTIESVEASTLPFIKTLVDGDDKLLEAIDKEGLHWFAQAIKVQGGEISIEDSNLYRFTITDENGGIIFALLNDNTTIPRRKEIPSDIKNYIDNSKPTEEERNSIEDYLLPIPSYYTEYLDKKIKKINNLFKNDSEYNTSFVFITDPHYPDNNGKSPRLIKYILRHTPIRKVLVGGDSCTTTQHKGVPSKDAVFDIAKNFVEWLCKPLQPYCKMYLANGNHDFAVAGLDGDTNFTAPLTLSRQVYLENIDNVVFNKDDKDCVYYYFDDDVQKIRFIVVNTSDTYLGKDNKSISQWIIFGNTQKKWLTENAIKTTPQGYDLIIMGHVPPTTPEHNYLPNLQSFIEAIQSKSTINIDNIAYDFKNAPNVLLTIWGHMHTDEITYQGGFPIVTSSCDAKYGDYQHYVFGNVNKFPAKSNGNIYEQTFEAVYVNKGDKIATFIKIGGGYDRKVHLDIKTLKVGNTLTLTTHINSPIWNIHDGKDNPINNGYIGSLNKTIASVDNGIVTGLKEGYSTVCAYSNDGDDMEIWGIKVE